MGSNKDSQKSLFSYKGQLPIELLPSDIDPYNYYLLEHVKQYLKYDGIVTKPVKGLNY